MNCRCLRLHVDVGRSLLADRDDRVEHDGAHRVCRVEPVDPEVPYEERSRDELFLAELEEDVEADGTRRIMAPSDVDHIR